MDRKVVDLLKKQIYFADFYNQILSNEIKKLKKCIEDKEAYFNSEIYLDFAILLSGQLQNICLRTLIVKMHEWKQKNLLEGQDAKEEYEFFCKEIIGKKEFREKVFREFPVLQQCVEEKCRQTVQFFTEVISYFQKEREEISQTLFAGKKIDKITKMEGGIADQHNGGKQVFKIWLDDTEKILFKPRSMQNEENYLKLLTWMENRTGIKQYAYPILSYSDHSWCSIVKYETCQSEEQIQNYYLRFGVQLFLSYFLGTTDLHCENVIACGEYPVLIDLEALVSHQITQSVLGIGLLPVYHWNRDGEGIDSSALGAEEGQRYPFKIPAILHAGTSEMCIDYQYPVSKKLDNRVSFNGKIIDASLYRKEIMDGFECAYQKVLAEKADFEKILRILSDSKSRVLMADTQRYSMLLSTSYHPSLLMNAREREKFLYSLWNGRDEKDKNIVESEVRSLKQGDIPYFYDYLNQTGLFSGSGEIEKDYFEKTAMETILDRLENLSEKDRKKQLEYIEVSMSLMPEQRKNLKNLVYVQEKDAIRKGNAEDREKWITILTERILDAVIWNEDKSEVSWNAVQLNSVGKWSWRIRPMDMYLYNGLSGMILLMYALKDVTKRKEPEKIFLILKEMLFRYTDNGTAFLAHLYSKNTGAYDGESSVLYTYVVLYQMSGEKIFLEYAKKHAEIIGKLLQEDEQYDFLSGNAGAAKVLLLLYEATSDIRYLKLAEQAVSLLEENAEKKEYGIGWCVVNGTAPMAGMAHGNSGVILSVMALWKVTGKEKYKQLAERILKYEDSLYDAERNNWRDLRDENGKNGEDAVAWCHGAAGILLSRVICYTETEEEEWKQKLKEDIKKAYGKLERCWKRDSWCLCHGTYGNLWILECAAEIMGEKLEINAPADIKLFPQEMMNPGLMNGYGGILYYLLREKTDKIVKILEIGNVGGQKSAFGGQGLVF